MQDQKQKKISKTVEVSGQDILPYILELTKYFEEKGVEVKPYPKLIISREKTLQENPLGKTAYYNPAEKSITLFVESRSLKDCLRSYSHELVHHYQNITGKLQEDKSDLSDPEYTKNNKHLRKIEAEAYLKGNILMREWEDQYKSK